MNVKKTKNTRLQKEKLSQRKQVIASQKDSEIFFDAIFNPKNPNKELIKAAEEFNRLSF